MFFDKDIARKANKAITVFLSFLIIATIPIIFAAVQPWVWSLYGLLMIAAFIFFLWAGQDRSSLPRSGYLKYAVMLFFIWTLFLCLPLPFSWLTFLSPTRADILSRAWQLTASPSAWQSVSYASASALTWWVFLLSLGLFFRVVRSMCRERALLRRIVFVMIGVGLVEAAYGLIQALVPSMGVLWVDSIHDYMGTARGTFINRNNFAGFIEMVWPLALGVTLAMTGPRRSLKESLGSDRLNRQALMALSIIVFLLALIFTRSRAGIVSGIFGLLVFAIMARTGVKAVALQTRVLLGGILLLLAVYTMTIGIGPIMVRFLTISEDGGSRIQIWRDSLPIIGDYPLGIGLQNYEDVFHVYNRSYASDKTVVYAHNDYLQLLIEAGWIGFIALAGAFLILMVKSARRIKRLDYREDPLQFYLAVGAFSGLSSMAVHSLFDFNLQIPANCLYFVVLLGILSACTQPFTRSTKPAAPRRERRGLPHDRLSPAPH